MPVEVQLDPAAVERSGAIAPSEVDGVEASVEAGSRHVTFMIGEPFELAPLGRLAARLGR